MYTDYLKNTLKRIAEMGSTIPERYGASNATVYATSALGWVTDYIEPIERERDRLVSIMENLGIDLDEETLHALEMIGSDERYKYERGALSAKIDAAITETQKSERDIEHDGATDALLAAGFAYDEDDDSFVRGHEQVRITLVNGRELRYKWEYETSDPAHRIESGTSGGFARLLAIVKPAALEDLR